MPRDYDWTEGILDNASIRDALKFAEAWHRTPWAIATLPRDLKATVRIYDEDPRDLGACIVYGRHRGIALNQRLVDTRGFVPVLAHECAHIFQPPGVVGRCQSSVQLSRREREAWWIASILAVPLESVKGKRFLLGDDANAVARHLEVPRPLVTMRAGVALLMGEMETRQSHYARLILEAATIAQQVWIARFSEQLAART